MTRAQKKEKGFTLLLASVVVSIILAVGASIFALAQKELILSSIGRDSQFAFYTADTAAECALFWDVRYNYFDPVAPDNVTPSCGGDTLVIVTGNPGENPSYPYEMQFQYEPNGYCASVYVTKDTNPKRTHVRADGFSTSCDSVETNPRTLQRSVELNY